MRSLRAFQILAAVIVVFSVVATASNITWGYIGPYDRLLAADAIFKPSRWFTTQTAEVVYPPKGHFNYLILSAVRIIDYGGRKNFAYATLKKGGPGHRNATIALKSQSGKPLNVTVQYFGR